MGPFVAISTFTVVSTVRRGSSRTSSEVVKQRVASLVSVFIVLISADIQFGLSKVVATLRKYEFGPLVLKF